MIKPCAVDFETEAIKPRPDYPPDPVSVSITYPTGKTIFLAWGHREDNNCTKAEAIRKLKDIYNKYKPVFHNSKFDLEVGEKHLSLPLVPKHGWDDSMLLAFLYNPREWSLKLKMLADKYLDMPPEEQNKLNDWILSHVFTSEKGGEGSVLIAKEKPKGMFKVPPSKVGAFICHAPVKLVSKYAKGDTIRTMKLFKKFYKHVKENGMLEQYEIEKRIIIKSVFMEREGIKIDVESLEPELKKAKKLRDSHELKLKKIVGDINFRSSKQIVESFEKLGFVDEWEYTDKGNEKTGVDSLLRVCTNKKVIDNLDMFSKYNKLIGTYMQPWLDSALDNDGLFFPWITTFKNEYGTGTYSGRWASNMQQISKKPSKKYHKLPFLRKFIIPDKSNHILLKRDYLSQEVRILAHYMEGSLLDAYNKEPYLDGHEFVRKTILETTGHDLPRSYVKAANFAIIYGGGVKALSDLLDISREKSKLIMNAHSTALPELTDLKNDLNKMARKGELFKTAGGRWYDFEEDREYVALNNLIQGSAADAVKRSVLNISDALEAESIDARMILQVHDEIILSANKRSSKKIMKIFKEVMEQDDLFDLPMLSDGAYGNNFGELIEFVY